MRYGVHHATWNASPKCRDAIRCVWIWPIAFQSRAHSMPRLQKLVTSRELVGDLRPAASRTGFTQEVMRGPKANPRYDTKVARTWEVVERNMKSAPGPDLVARHVLKLINAGRPPARVTVGDAFQSKIAPLIFRFLPQRIGVWGLRRYYRL